MKQRISTIDEFIINENYNSNINEAAKKIFPEDLIIGETYKLGYRKIVFLSKFLGWEIDEGPIMKFVVVDEINPDHVTEWEAYMYKGYMAIGSSADKLIIHEKV